jgi:predicted nucleic acid-binding protein
MRPDISGVSSEIPGKTRRPIETPLFLAKRLSAKLALIDERRARTLAVKEGLAVSGSIAILENGYQKNHVSDL